MSAGAGPHHVDGIAVGELVRYHRNVLVLLLREGTVTSRVTAFTFHRNQTISLDSAIQSRTCENRSVKILICIDGERSFDLRSGTVCRICVGYRYGVEGFGFEVQSSGFRVQGFGFRVWGMGSRV